MALLARASSLCGQKSETRRLEACATIDLLIEVGPGAVLSHLVRETTDVPVVALDAGGNSLSGLLQALGAAFALGRAGEDCRAVRRPFRAPICAGLASRNFSRTRASWRRFPKHRSAGPRPGSNLKLCRNAPSRCPALPSN